MRPASPPPGERPRRRSERRRPPGPRGEGGYVLLAALLALLAVSALSTAGFVVTRSDARVAASHRATVEAREAARAGLSRYLATNRSPAPVERYAFGRSEAEVRTEPLVAVGSGGRRLYLLTSRGVTVRRRGPDAARVLSAVVVHDPGELSPPGALSSGASLTVPGGGTASVDGRDACSGSSAPAVAGVAVPTGRFSGDVDRVRGQPPVDDTRPGDVLLAASGLDSAVWAGLEDGAGVPADRLIPGEGWPSAFTDWPVVLVAGSAQLDDGESGRGTLVVTGDLALGGSFRWDGLVLVGGALTAGDDSAVNGAVLAGLDRLHGASPAGSTVAGSATLRYDSCAMLNASRRAFEGLALRPGTRYEVVGG